MIPEWLMQVGGMILGGAGAGVGLYVGIRTDLASMKVKVDVAAADAARAHARIDNLTEKVWQQKQNAPSARA